MKHTPIVMLFVLLLAGLVQGCTTLSPDEAEYRNAQIMEAHALCQSVWASQGWVWESVGTRTAMDTKLGRPPKPHAARQEILHNGCMRYVKSLGFDL